MKLYIAFSILLSSQKVLNDQESLQMFEPSTITAMISAFMAIIAVVIAYLNRKDSSRPHLYVYLNDYRNDEGEIQNEVIYIRNMGNFPAYIKSVNVNSSVMIYSRNKQYGLNQPGDNSQGNDYIKIDNALKNKLIGTTILPGDGEKVGIKIIDPALSNREDLEELETLNSVSSYREDDLRSNVHSLKITLKYRRVIKPLLPIRGIDSFKETFHLIENK